MNSSQGYYSIVQYSEYPERAEYVNIGVALFTDVAPRVFVRFAKSPRRVENAFGVRIGSHFKNLLLSVKSRLGSEFHGSCSRDDIDRFIQLRTGKIRLSPPRSVLVDNPSDTLDGLFDSLVDDPMPNRQGQRATTIPRRRA